MQPCEQLCLYPSCQKFSSLLSLTLAYSDLLHFPPSFLSLYVCLCLCLCLSLFLFLSLSFSLPCFSLSVFLSPCLILVLSSHSHTQLSLLAGIHISQAEIKLTAQSIMILKFSLAYTSPELVLQVCDFSICLYISAIKIRGFTQARKVLYQLTEQHSLAQIKFLK